jgi:hypothetical protein
MAFDRKQSVIPTAIWGIRMLVDDPEPGDIDEQRIRSEIDVRKSDGSVEVVRVNLAEHLTANQINGLRTLMASIRTKANAEILP